MRTKNNKLMGDILNKVLLALLVMLPNHNAWGRFILRKVAM